MIFAFCLLIGWAFVLSHGFLAYYDGGGYLTQAQMQSRGIKGWSFMEHGGMWFDFFILTPVVAYIVSHYKLPILSKTSIAFICGIIVALICFGFFYSSKTFGIPEAHTHDGKTAPAGYVHGVYALIVAWVLFMFYFKISMSADYRHDIKWVSMAPDAVFLFRSREIQSQLADGYVCIVSNNRRTHCSVERDVVAPFEAVTLQAFTEPVARIYTRDGLFCLIFI